MPPTIIISHMAELLSNLHSRPVQGERGLTVESKIGRPQLPSAESRRAGLRPCPPHGPHTMCSAIFSPSTIQASRILTRLLPEPLHPSNTSISVPGTKPRAYKRERVAGSALTATTLTLEPIGASSSEPDCFFMTNLSVAGKGIGTRSQARHERHVCHDVSPPCLDSSTLKMNVKF